MRVLSLVNQKGGCGKTTTAINLAGALASRGARVLLVDLDPQAHATLGLGCDAEDSPSVFEVLLGRVGSREALRRAAGGIALWPAHQRLAEFEELATRGLHGERALRRVLEPLARDFDLALLDCPPRVDGALAANALYASSAAVLVVETGAFALQGALRAAALLEETARAQGSQFDVRVLATLFDRRTKLARELLIAMHARFGSTMFESAVRSCAKLREAAVHGVPIQVHAPRSSGADDFAALADEVLRLALVLGRELSPAAVELPASTAPKAVLVPAAARA